MRTQILIAAVLALAPLTSFAHEHEEGPCKKIIEKCEAGGYKRGAHKATGKGAVIDCLDKLLKGEPVAGVTATPEEVTGCKAVKGKHHKK